MRIQSTHPLQHPNASLWRIEESRGRGVGHSGQDPQSNECRVHDRVRSALRTVSVDMRQNLRKSELDSVNIISIDEHLLTGDLEEDISILSIVA